MNVLGTPALDLPDHGLRLRTGPIGTEVFDGIRKKWMLLTPEEWVRQHFINHLVIDRGCPASLISVEKALTLNELAKRADIVVHGRDGAPLALVECKSPSIKLDLRTLEQAARYNIVFKVRYLMVTNGRQHFCFHIDHQNGNATRLDHIPDHLEMTTV